MNSVLAIAPVSRGFGFVVLDSSQHAIDWGIKEVRENKNAISIAKTIDIFGAHRPAILAIEDWRDPKSRRQRRTKILLRDLSQAAAVHGIIVARFDKDQIREVFAEYKVETNGDIATAVAHFLRNCVLSSRRPQSPGKANRTPLRSFTPPHSRFPALLMRMRGPRLTRM